MKKLTDKFSLNEFISELLRKLTCHKYKTSESHYNDCPERFSVRLQAPDNTHTLYIDSGIMESSSTASHHLWRTSYEIRFTVDNRVSNKRVSAVNSYLQYEDENCFIPAVGNPVNSFSDLIDFINGSLEHESQAPKVFSLSDILGSLSMNNNADTSNSNMNSKPKSDTSEQKCPNNLIESIIDVYKYISYTLASQNQLDDEIHNSLYKGIH